MCPKCGSGIFRDGIWVYCNSCGYEEVRDSDFSEIEGDENKHVGLVETLVDQK